jgi:hypothetical protein
MNNEPDYKALEALVVDNPDLERLEMLLDEFNMFEAIGATWQETRHSDLLAFLLNPQQNHGLGDIFLKRLLQKALILAQENDVASPVTSIDLDVWDLDQTIVLRESQRIDILLLDERHRMVAIIENKLTSTGNSFHLERYWESVSQLYPGWTILGLYLTPDGEPPPDGRYISIDYGVVCSLIEGLTESRASTLREDVRTMMIHYTRMLRRHIVGESEITRLCRRIYGKHQRAFDLIYEHRLSRQKVIRNVTRLLIEQKQGLLLDHSQERYTGFAVQEWDVPALLEGRADGVRPGRVLLFEFDTWQDTLPLRLHIGPCSDQLRQRLLDLAMAHQPPFKIEDSPLAGGDWITIFERSFLTPEFYEEASTDELAEKILQNWADFLKNDLTSMNTVLREQPWVWQKSRS